MSSASASDAVDRFIARASNWPEEMTALRAVLLKAGLAEDIKWGKPCYSSDGRNVAIMQPMKQLLALMFFEGAALDDPGGLLEEQGPNSRSAKRVRITSVADVRSGAKAIRALIEQAVALPTQERPAAPAAELVLVDELQARLESEPALRLAFEALTPGRRREYNLHISSAKQSATREERITRCTERILAGKGLRDR